MNLKNIQKYHIYSIFFLFTIIVLFKTGFVNAFIYICLNIFITGFIYAIFAERKQLNKIQFEKHLKNITEIVQKRRIITLISAIISNLLTISFFYQEKILEYII